MPKSRIQDRATKTKKYSVVKFKIGGRKSNRSALDMTVEELQNGIASDSTRGRDKHKMRQVLRLRRIAA